MNAFASEDDLINENMNFIPIIDYNWAEGEMMFIVQYGNDDHQQSLTIPFGI